jgi:hypothetical protein
MKRVGFGFCHGSPEVFTGPEAGCVFVSYGITVVPRPKVSTSFRILVLRVVFVSPGTIADDLFLTVMTTFHNFFVLVTRGSLLRRVALHLIFLITMRCLCCFFGFFSHL